MATIKFIDTTASKVDSIEQKGGQVIFVRDKREIILDTADGERTEYKQIIILLTDTQRQNIESPVLGGFYFVKETLILWNYDEEDGWIRITSAPTSQIEFLDNQTLPDIGNTEKLYIKENELYRWYDGEYHLCGNDNEWEIVN